MAQRYSDPIAHERMAQGLCPECAEFSWEHVNDMRFWVPRRCLLLPQGVEERIAQHLADVAESREVEASNARQDARYSRRDRTKAATA